MTRYARVSPQGRILEVVPLADPPPARENLAKGKPYFLPLETENEAFDEVTQVREGPERLVEPGRVVDRYTVRLKTIKEIAAMRDVKVAAVKDEAQRRILDIMPSHQQVNWLARKAELDILHGPDAAGWPAEAKAEVAAMLAKWDRIKAIRARSNKLEDGISHDPHEIVAFNPLRGWD